MCFPPPRPRGDGRWGWGQGFGPSPVQEAGAAQWGEAKGSRSLGLPRTDPSLPGGSEACFLFFFSPHSSPPAGSCVSGTLAARRWAGLGWASAQLCMAEAAGQCTASPPLLKPFGAGSPAHRCRGRPQPAGTLPEPWSFASPGRGAARGLHPQRGPSALGCGSKSHWHQPGMALPGALSWLSKERDSSGTAAFSP